VCSNRGGAIFCENLLNWFYLLKCRSTWHNVYQNNKVHDMYMK
jgi:hypothetical protein